ncbi:hypothetical protein TOK_2661 [Pseudonocardia sp. N23]|nr:hypothetical protein TOK_2661 [Pseudonocardia sp. N23]
MLRRRGGRPARAGTRRHLPAGDRRWAEGPGAYEIERLTREAPFLLIGEGTSGIRKAIISRGLLKTYALTR